MRHLAAVALVACSQPAPPPTRPTPGSASSSPKPAPIDAPPASQDEKLAAIQKAMNELDEAAQVCWATAATDRFDIEGELTVMIEIAAGSATATVVTDTARNAKLATCVTGLLGGYRWAPPLYGETIQLPFKFRAPDGQSVIDRRLVEWHGQQRMSVAVLLDENNTGNAAASMLEIALQPQATTGLRRADRAELWYFHGAATVAGQTRTGRTVAGISKTVKAGDFVYVPAGSVREISATGDLHAFVVMAPGGREGTARAGALPTPEADHGIGLPRVLTGTQHGPATIFLDKLIDKTTPLAASILELAAGATVAEHVHAGETELLYVLEGAGTMTINGQAVAVVPTSVIQIPPNTKHSFTATARVRSVQLYTPAGPEQRFKKP